MRKIELLAPAKNKQIGIDAINYGADAVYIGGENFSARSNAGNSLEEIKELVEYAHRFNVKVYVALNTIFTDEQLPLACKLAHDFYDIGVDALIIQDYGLLECDLPNISLHSSTQMNNDTIEKVKFLEDVGFKRSILARELSLENIKNIKQATNIELEVFVQGSLCVCYSGQCYMSYAIGKRSANRGECGQICRKRFSIEDDKGGIISKPKHLLSLKDLNMSNHLEKLIDIGVSSFKIEGRLKDSDYVKNVVAYYRKTIDEIIKGKDIQRSSSGQTHFDFEPDLYKTFNRGFSDYFAVARNKRIWNFDTPKSIGEPLGKILSLSKNGFKLDENTAKLNPADGVCFVDSKGELLGTSINSFKDGLYQPRSFYGLEVGTFLYRNYNREFSNILAGSKTYRAIDAELKVSEEDGYITIEAVDEDGNVSSVNLKNDFQPANDYEKALSTLKKQILKFGDTIFNIKSLKISLHTTPFIPVKTINDVRRELSAKMLSKRVLLRENIDLKPLKNTVEYPIQELDYKANVINQKARKFFAMHSAKVLELGAEAGTNLKNKDLMTCKHCLRYALNKCLKTINAYKDKSVWYLVDEKNVKYRLDFDCDNCEMKVVKL